MRVQHSNCTRMQETAHQQHLGFRLLVSTCCQASRSRYASSQWSFLVALRQHQASLVLAHQQPQQQCIRLAHIKRCRCSSRG